MSDTLVSQIRDKYAGVARSGLTNDSAGVAAVAEAFGYTPEELESLPAEANMGLSCGNPTATAHLKPGEVVVDLGSGGGIDVLLAAKKVGPAGKAIGIDMTPEMIGRANVAAIKAGVTNAEFLLARMESIPLPDNSADVIISNCVINLAPDKSAVFREMYRILKPGGRVAVSDIALKQPLPNELIQCVAAYVGCIAGAITIADYERLLREAGFTTVQVVDSKKDLNAYAKIANQSSCCGSGSNESQLHEEMAKLIAQYDANQFAASVRVFALKPANSDTPLTPVLETPMTTLQVFDKPMCCSTGICGPKVDPVLPQFASDLAWLKDQGVAVERFNLAQQPQAFVNHADVKEAISENHEVVLPLVRVNGEIVSKRVYPTRAQLASWCGVSQLKPLSVSEPAAGSCCGTTSCC